jgi:hypothetical protein
MISWIGPWLRFDGRVDDAYESGRNWPAASCLFSCLNLNPRLNMKQSDTFLGGGEVHGEDHLWLILNDPSAHAGVALIVNVSTLRLGAETTCIVQPGEHPFINHDSYVRYGSARKVKADILAEAVHKGLLKLHQPAGKAFLEKVRAGAKASPLLAMELRALL